MLEILLKSEGAKFPGDLVIKHFCTDGNHELHFASKNRSFLANNVFENYRDDAIEELPSCLPEPLKDYVGIEM